MATGIFVMMGLFAMAMAASSFMFYRMMKEE